jgi:hypothetical protein
MTTWRRFELTWRDELCRAALPTVDGVDLPGWDAGDTEAFWARFEEIAPASLRRGWRLGVWAATLAACVRRGPRRLRTMTPTERDAFLDDLATHRWHTMRQVASVLRLVVAFGYLTDPAVRGLVCEGSPS